MSYLDGGANVIIGKFHQTGPQTGICNSKFKTICGIWQPPTGTTDALFTFPPDFCGPYPAGTSFNSTINAYQCSSPNLIPLDTGCTKEGELTAIIQFAL